MNRALLSLIVFLIVACGGNVDEEAPQRTEEQTLTCYDENDVASPCPSRVYKGFHLPVPDGLQDTPGKLSQALAGDAFCTLPLASNTGTSAPPCCYGSSRCFVSSGSNVITYNCGVLSAPGLCSRGTSITTYDMISGLPVGGTPWSERPCACATLKPGSLLRQNDSAEPCNLSATFGGIHSGFTNPPGKLSVCGRPNKGFRPFLQRGLGAFNGSYTCTVDLGFPLPNYVRCNDKN